MILQLQTFLIGAATAAFIPFISFLYNKYKKRNDLKVIKEMIFREYIDPLDKLTDSLSIDTSDEYRSKVFEKLKRLDYLLDSEVKYMNEENRFEVIRMIQYTMMYYKQVLNNVDAYRRPDQFKSPDSIERLPRSIKEFTKQYKETLNDYMNLKRDYFI